VWNAILLISDLGNEHGFQTMIFENKKEAEGTHPDAAPVEKEITH